MKKAMLVVLVLGLAMPAFADFTLNGRTVYTNAVAQPLGQSEVLREAVVYSNMTGNFFGPVSGTGDGVSVDDYVLDVPAGETAFCKAFRFGGGVAEENAGTGDVAGDGIFWVTFFDSAGSFYDSFGVQLGTGGNFFWTITLANGIAIPENGTIQMWADDGTALGSGYATTANWFLTDAAPTVGTTTDYPGYSATTTSGAVLPLNHLFEITTPEPATLALFGAGLLVLVSRRR